MTTFKLVVEDEQAGLLKKLLEQVSFVKSIEESPAIDAENSGAETTLEQIKKIQQEIGNKNLFKGIKDPVEWQREIRKEWDRDF
jgi:Xaa-Pro aminopeptidase